MSIVLIEKKGTVQNPRDGALLNHFAVSKQSGRLFGCQITYPSSDEIYLSEGVIIVRGYRIANLDLNLIFDGAHVSIPEVQTKYNIIYRVTTTDTDASLELLIGETDPINKDEIERTTGVFDYLLGFFLFGPQGIVAFTDEIKDVQILTGGSGSSGGGSDAIPLVSLTTAPETPSINDHYYSSTEEKVYYWDGSSWTQKPNPVLHI